MTTTHIQVPDEVYRDSGAETRMQRTFVRDGYLAGLAAQTPTAGVLAEVAAERLRQEAKFPEQHLPDGTSEKYAATAELGKTDTDKAAADGTLTWLHVLREEYYEALAETDPAKLRAELIQVAAVAARWVEDIDRRVATNQPDRCGTCDVDGLVTTGTADCTCATPGAPWPHEPHCGYEPCPNGCFDRLNPRTTDAAKAESEAGR